MEITNFAPLRLDRVPKDDVLHSSPVTSAPQIVGAYSVDKERRLFAGFGNCKYLCNLYNNLGFDPIPVEYDLNDGIQNIVRKPDQSKDNEEINYLLRFILSNFCDFSSNESNSCEAKAITPDVVCSRGLLRMLMSSAYEGREGWTILATNYNGSLYLYAKQTNKKREEIENRPQKVSEILSYESKFKQYILSGKARFYSFFAIY